MDWYEIFPKLLNMSLTASVIIVFVLLARLLLRKTPRIYSYVLWVVVLFRLLCPVSLSAPFSLLGAFDAPVVEGTANTSAVEYVPSNLVHEEYPQVTLPIPGVSNAVNETLPQGWVQVTFDPLEAPVTIATYIWMLGVVAMLGCGVISYCKLRQKLTGAPHLRGNIFVVDHISSPFVMGILRPKIYLSSALEEQEREYIILHEQQHIRRLDHIFKALAFLALCIHWFNPLVWAAFILSSRDMEMSCDEAVIKRMGEGIRADYSASLLSLAAGQRIHFGTPLAFGEGDTKGRIKNLARWRKPAIGITIAAIVVCVAVILVCVFNPETELMHALEPAGHTLTKEMMLYEAPDKTSDIEAAAEADPLEMALSAAILGSQEEKDSEDYFHCESHVIFGNEVVTDVSSEVPAPDGNEHIRSVTVYAMVLTQKYDLSSGAVVDMGGSHMPTAMTFEVNEAGEYALTECWFAMDGSYYEPSIREKFPDPIEEDALDTQKYILAQKQDCYAQAVKYGNLDTDAIVARLLDEILASPGLETESGLARYIENESITYQELTYYGTYTLEYCFREFSKGGQTDLRGLLMAEVCKDIMEGFGEAPLIDDTPANGQEWFEEFRKNAKSLEG